MTERQEIAHSETLAAADPPWSKHEEQASLDAQYEADQAYWSSPAGIEHQAREFRASREHDPAGVCGGPNTGCEQDGEMQPGSFGMECVPGSQDIYHGPTCPARWST